MDGANKSLYYIIVSFSLKRPEVVNLLLIHSDFLGWLAVLYLPTQEAWASKEPLTAGDVYKHHRLRASLHSGEGWITGRDARMRGWLLQISSELQFVLTAKLNRVWNLKRTPLDQQMKRHSRNVSKAPLSWLSPIITHQKPMVSDTVKKI